MRMELVIDELVLHGFDPRQRHAIGDAVEAELARLLGENDLAAEFTASTIEAEKAVMTTLAQGAGASVVGRAIARSVLSALPRSAGGATPGAPRSNADVSSRTPSQRTSQGAESR